jgi:hypothetical protein
MASKLQAAVVMLCMSSYAAAGTPSIGSASAQGQMRVDGYSVEGNATLFDGSIVETDNAAAALRLDRNVRITMASGSRGTLYRDRLVLERGKSEATLPAHFEIDADSLHVTSALPGSRAVVTVNSSDLIEVASLSGDLQVTNAGGLVLARVAPGHSLSFAMKAGTSTSFASKGIVSEVNGHFYLTASDTGVRYEIVGKNLSKYVGQKVLVSGSINSTTAAVGGAAYTVTASSVVVNGALAGFAGLSLGSQLLVGGIIVGSSAAVATGTYFAVTSTPAASI